MNCFKIRGSICHGDHVIGFTFTVDHKDTRVKNTHNVIK